MLRIRMLTYEVARNKRGFVFVFFLSEKKNFILHTNFFFFYSLLFRILGQVILYLGGWDEDEQYRFNLTEPESVSFSFTMQIISN